MLVEWLETVSKVKLDIYQISYSNALFEPDCSKLQWMAHPVLRVLYLSSLLI
jgi:hypothetical protein